MADAVLPAGGRDVIRSALPALTALAEAPEGTRLVWAGAESGSYPVFFGEGLIAAGFLYPADGRRFVVTDANVARHHVLEGHERIEVEPGEERKTLAAAEDVLRALARAGAERGDLVVAVGGGVVGDLAGFCAAVYQRGMRHVQVPTTLVAQVDSAYGGKTGVDLPEGKNYAGAYHQPSAVICDPAALATLPREELAAGYVEVVKTALIAGGPLWARVRQGGEPDLETVIGCARTKLAVVAEDERDGGRRQVLNLGHTVGHAIEAATGYTRYRHGEAVGHRPAGGPAALGARGAARRGVRPAGGARAAARVRGRRRGRRARARGARQEALGRPGAVRARGVARGGHARARGGAGRAPRGGRGGARGMSGRVDVLHGVNLDTLGRRDPAHYGELTLTELEVKVKRFADELGLDVAFFQTNHEGQFCEWLHRAGENTDGLILNPGAWTHYSYAIRDALEVADLPAVEVHLSAIDEREEWRRLSVIRDLCIGTVQGKGADGYREALEMLKEALAK